MIIGLAGLALYAATAAGLIWAAGRFVSPIRSRPVWTLALAPMLFTGWATVTGGVYGALDVLYGSPPFSAEREALAIGPPRSPSLGDVVYQHIPWREAVRRDAAKGRLPLWNPDVLAGEPLLAAQQAGILRPTIWISFLLPPPQAWTYDMSVRLLTALLCAYLLMRELGCGEIASLLGAAGWAFSDFLIFFLGFSIAPPTAPFPLALLAARRVARAPDGRSVALLALSLAAALAGGHPETALHTSCAAGLFFLFELAGAGPGRRGRAVAYAFLAGILAAGLTAVILLPLAEALPLTAEQAFRKAWYAHSPRAAPWRECWLRLQSQVSPYIVGVDGQGRVREGFLLPAAYGGALLLPLAAGGLLARRRERWFFAGIAVLGLGVCLKTPAADWITRLPFFDVAINEYLIVLPMLSLCVLAALGAERLARGEGRRGMVLASAAAAIAVAALAIAHRPAMLALGMPSGYARWRLGLQLLPLAALAALAGRRPRGGRDGLMAALLVLFLVSRVAEEGAVNPTLPARSFFPPIPLLSSIPRGSPERIVATGVNFLPNVSAVYDLEDVRGYEAMTLAAYQETYPLWCVRLGAWFNRVDDPTRPFVSFLNVRWALLPQDAAVPDGWRPVAASDGLRLAENPKALPRVFAPRWFRGERPKSGLGLIADISDFAERGVIEADMPDRWVENGKGRVRIERYEGSSLSMAVDAEADMLLGTSIPAWPGWKAVLDGRPAASVTFNHAFLAYRVPAGSHRLTLDYEPDSVRYGAVASLAAAILGAIVFARGSRSRPGGPAAQSGSATTTD